MSVILFTLSLLVQGKPSALYEKDNPDWAPSKKLGHENVKALNPERYLRQEQQRKHKIGEQAQNQNETVDGPCQQDIGESAEKVIKEGKIHKGTQTEIISGDYEVLRNECAQHQM